MNGQKINYFAIPETLKQDIIAFFMKQKQEDVFNMTVALMQLPVVNVMNENPEELKEEEIKK